MLAWPVAAARIEPPTAAPLLHQRLRALFERAAPEKSRQVLDRLLPASSNGHLREEGFVWLRFARALGSQLGLDSTADGRRRLDDLCWMQYCVFAVFRLQDDLLDGETDDATLAVQANHLLVEAARTAARHFAGDSPFWTVFQNGIDQTAEAIVELDVLQRSDDRMGETELDLFARQAACLKLAIAGVAIAAELEETWGAQLSPAFDGLAVAAQMIDDLQDIRDDLTKGRVNHAAWFLSHPVIADTPEAIEAVVASNLATTDRLDHFLTEARRRMDRGLDVLDSEFTALRSELTDYRDALFEVAREIRARTQALLTPEASYSSAGSSLVSGSTQNR